MTMEQFDKAQELYNEKEVVSEVENLLGNWTSSTGDLNKLTMIYGNNAFKPGEICNQINGYSAELKNRLIQTCHDYYNELMKQFKEI